MQSIVPLPLRSLPQCVKGAVKSTDEGNLPSPRRPSTDEDALCDVQDEPL